MEFTKLSLKTPPVPTGARELHVVFIPGRGALLRNSMQVKAAGATRREIVGQLDRQPNVFVFPLEQDQELKQQAINVFTLSDLPTPAFYVFSLGPDLRVAAPNLRDAAAGHDGFEYEDLLQRKAEDVVFGPDFYRQGVIDSVKTEPRGDIRRYREYFRDLELGSNPTLLPRLDRTRTHVEALMPTLRRRARIRAVHFDRDPLRSRPPLLRNAVPALRTSVAALSRLQLLLVERYFSSASGLDLRGFEEAYELFSNGELRRKVPGPNMKALGFWVTQPSSAYYVFFAEFAFLAIECDVDKSRWLELVNVMARTQCVYFRAYRPKSVAHAGFRDYTAENYRKSHKVPESEIADLKTDMGTAMVPDMYSFVGEAAKTHMPRFAKR